MSLQENLNKINGCLDELYSKDEILFNRNDGRGLCERCIVFRFALYLQKSFNKYFVDCDFNSSNFNGQEKNGKIIGHKKRFIDIIVHRRASEADTDFICFEIKKWNSKPGKENKDEKNLKILTSEYGYKFGFHVILGKTRIETKIDIFENGRKIQTN
jgi:hypothetical protein